jgi:hypothetical protein
MTPENVTRMIEWVGPEGTVAGLDRGHLTNSELMMLARESGILMDKKTARRQMAIEIVMSSEKRITVPPEKLLEMSKDELQRYFSDHMVSSKEIMALLEDFEIAPKGKVRKLSEFAANEISDLGMYQRVAKGKPTESRARA